MKNFIISAVLLLTPFSFVGALTSDQISQRTSASYMRVYYYQEGKNARASFNANVNSIDVFAPQTYSFNSTGKLVGSVAPDLLKTAKNNQIKVMPLVTNGAFSQASFKLILDNPKKQDAYINLLVKEAKKYEYWGWQIDFEQMDLTYRDKFSVFVKKFGNAMKKEGLVSSVAVIAQISEKPEDYPKNLWHRIIGVYDYKSLGESTDFISLMSYDDPESTGPVARYTWMERVVNHSLTLIPKEKLSLGIPFYNWEWDDARGKIVEIGGHRAVAFVLSNYKVTKGYDKKEHAPYLKYKVNGKKYTLWYENEKSIEKKLDLITEYDLHGFSAWALGLGGPDIHKTIANKGYNFADFTYSR